MIAANYSIRVLITVFSSFVALTAISEAAPVVNSTIPAADATNGAINIPVIATFSEAMNGATINSSTFRLEKLVPGTMTFILTETAGPTTTYTPSYTTEPFAGIYQGTYWGYRSGTFYCGVSGDREIRGFSFNSSEADYFSTYLSGTSSPWSFSSTSWEDTSFSGTLTAASTSGSWNNSGHTGSFSGSKILGNNGIAGYNKDVYTDSDNIYWIAAAEVSGGTIKGYVVDLGTPDVFYGTGTVYADNSFSVTNIYSGHYGNKVASASGTLNPAGVAVTGSVSYDASTHSATFTPSSNLSANSTYRATITNGVTNATGTTMSANKIWSFATGNLTANKLTITINGSGSGKVTSSPSVIACDYPTQTGFCSAFFTGSSVNLSAAADPGSLFNGWGSDCAACSVTPCTVTLNSFKTCTAGFAAKMVIINGIVSDGYATLQKAYDTATNNALLMARSGTLSEDVLLDDDKSIRIYGGYNSDFSSPTGVTEIDGSLTIARGALTVEDLVIM
jgi:hypothetical protein